MKKNGQQQQTNLSSNFDVIEVQQSKKHYSIFNVNGHVRLGDITESCSCPEYGVELSP
jgi:uncharacterized protein (DUF2249 family)